jgi:glutathione S-transferase
MAPDGVPLKLYFAPFACSLASHIALREAGQTFELEKTDIRNKKTASGGDFIAINPKGYVPALQLEDGSVITEGAAILQYIADLAPESGLAPANGTLPRVRLQEWLGFIATEVHKAYSPLFNPAITEDAAAAAKARLAGRYAWIDTQLAGRDFLLGDTFTVADAYLFVVSNWGGRMGIDIAQWPNVAAWFGRVGARPAVGAAMGAEASA